MEVRGNKLEREFACIQYMACSPPRDSVENVFGCVRLRCSTDGHKDHVLVERPWIFGEDSLRAVE